MKKLLFLTLNIIIFSATVYAEIKIEGISYLSSEEVEMSGFRFQKDLLIFQEEVIEIKKDSVKIDLKDFKFPKASLIKGDEIYYNQYLIRELKTVDLKKTKKLKNIISLSPGITEKIFALGMGGELVGRTKYCRYPKKVLKVQVMGSLEKPNLEKVISKYPEIVIMETHYNNDVMKQLERLGIHCRVYITPRNLSEVYFSYKSLGEALGVPGRSAVVVASLKSQVAGFDYENRNLKKKPKVYYVVGAGRGEYTAGGDTFINDIIIHSGAINIAGNKKGWSYSLEELIVNNPDYIIGDKMYTDIIKKSRKYSSLKAVREGRVFSVDEYIFSLPGNRAIEEGIPLIMSIIKN